ncbi:MAG: DegT/DnrJ/EryC1/StrS family aminotransferase [Clostridiales bacterium]|nr:DegT/DnrJ/EryC1/StrS family aminotransferase [Clostridiales bacterium]
MSLAEQLKAAAERDKLRLHTPGHKGAVFGFDLTELSDGSFPADFVTVAERRAAEIYGARHAHYLSGGSSQGVKASIFYSGVNAVVDINSHRSVFDGFKLSGKRCVTAGNSGDIRPLTVEQIDKALTADIRAVVVTTPTYYGFCADVDGIAEYCKKRGLLFIADSAHGAHFGFSDRLPKNVAPVADICNVSTHKTLSALTQSALLLDNLSDDNSAKLRESVAVMGSTSPSYLLYATIDGAVAQVADKQTAEAYERLFGAVENIKTEFPFLNNDDFTRLVLDCTKLEVSPAQLNNALAGRGVYSELVSDKYIVFILTAEDSPSTVTSLGRALHDGIREIKVK